MKFFYSFQFFIIFFAFVFIFSLCLFVPIFSQSNNTSINSHSNYYIGLDISGSNLIWPTPGYTTITSGFGYRVSPTTGAGSYHSGIDIGAPQGSNIIACQSRKSYIYWF